MKKSQVLAALALAFALGLAVIPSANTYAKITENTATDTQKTAAYDEAHDLLASLATLENYGDYASLYRSLETQGNAKGIIEKLQDVEKAQLRIFNVALSNNAATNVYINRVNDILNRRVQEINDADISNKDHARFQTIPVFTTYKSLAAAYEAVENVLDIVAADLDIMRNNYQYTATNVIGELNDQFAAINSDLKGSGNVVTGLNTALAAVMNGAGGINAGTTTWQNLAHLVENIDEDAYDKMVRDENWNTAPANDIEVAENYGLIIKTAKNLPKYTLAGAVAAAEAKVANIPANVNYDVDYKNAIDYLEELKNAIESYKNGKAPADANKPSDGTGDNQNSGNKAPNTGVLADAEGSASTTVAMVAGIATALTAAGAGVVAYRNARRSTRK